MRKYVVSMLVLLSRWAFAETNTIAQLEVADNLREEEITGKLWVYQVSQPYMELELNSNGTCRTANNGCCICPKTPVETGKWTLQGNRLVLWDLKESGSSFSRSLTNRFYRDDNGLLLFVFPSDQWTPQLMYPEHFYFRVSTNEPQLLTMRWSEPPPAGAAGGRSP